MPAEAAVHPEFMFKGRVEKNPLGPLRQAGARIKALSRFVLPAEAARSQHDGPGTTPRGNIEK
jgi:hypothetical protein